MKSLVMAYAIIFLASTQAKVITMSCDFRDLGTLSKVYITMEETNGKYFPIGLEETGFTDYEGRPTPFSYDNEDVEWIWYLLLSEDGGFGYDGKGNMIFALDSDGCDVGKIQLYKNSNFKYGFIKVEHRCSGRNYPDSYSRVRCAFQ